MLGNWTSSLIWNALVASVFGFVAVVFPFPFITLAIWLGVLLLSARKKHGARAGVGIALQIGIMVLIIIAAVKAPVKTTEQFLDRTIELPKKSMTLGEIEGDPNQPKPEWRPFSIHVRVEPDEKENEVTFPSTSLTLREFVVAIESQSTLRHRFGHCGNGSTILYGGDCSFGLSLRRPR